MGHALIVLTANTDGHLFKAEDADDLAAAERKPCSARLDTDATRMRHRPA